MAKRDTEFAVATVPLTGTELVAIIQDGVNKIVPVQEIANLASVGGGGTLNIATKTAAFSPTVAEGKNYYRYDSVSAANCTLPDNAAQAFPIGFSMTLRQVNTAAITVVPGAGVSLNYPTDLNPKTRARYSSIAVVKVDTDAWELTGDLEPL